MLVKQGSVVAGAEAFRTVRMTAIRTALVAAAVLGITNGAVQGAAVPVYFVGAAQSFAATVDLTGSFNATGSGVLVNPITSTVEAFTLTEPTSHPLAINGGPVVLATQPKSAGFATFDITGGHATSAAGVNLNLLGGTFANFALLPINVSTSMSLLPVVPIDITGTLSSLVFQQTGSASFSPTGAGTGSFAIDGKAAAALLNINASALGLLNVPVTPQYLHTPLTLAGTYTITGDDANPKIELDGALDFGLPLDVASALSAAIQAPLGLTVDAALGLAATVSVKLGFHLEQTGIYVPPSGQSGEDSPANFKFGSLLSFDAAGQPYFQPLVPEPGSAMLLLIGLAAAAPLAIGRWKRRSHG